MLADAQERRFDVIVAEDIDRLARRAEAAEHYEFWTSRFTPAPTAT
jgi:DNA invertase Pin-like site-specific DNA recombinase